MLRSTPELARRAARCLFRRAKTSAMNDHTAQQSFIPTTGPLGRHSAAVGNALRETREAWPGLSTYERFEQVVSLVLTALIGLVIIAAVVNLTVRVVTLVLFGVLDPAEHGVFQAIFGMIFTVLITLEFNHSILGVLERQESIVQVKTVVLIALLALGGVYWFVRDQDRNEAARGERPTSVDAAGER